MNSVIAIGGSAGALDALLALATALPASFATPIVVVLHLAPNQKSLLAELIVRRTGRPCVEIEDKQPLEVRTIHVAPPNYHVLLERTGTLSLSVDEPVQFSRPSIDVLFESVARAAGPRAVGIVLSGANDDGAAGLARIAAAGGAAFVQDPATAQQRAMPVAAIARVPAAHVMTIPELGHHLAAGKAVS
jgi:two-component system chemotaxis response regulator CheB